MSHHEEKSVASGDGSTGDQRYREFIEKEIASTVRRKRRMVVLGLVLMLLFYGLAVSVLSSVVEASRNPDSLVNRIVAGMENKMPGILEAGRKEAGVGAANAARDTVRRLRRFPRIIETDVEAEELQRGKMLSKRLRVDLSAALIEKVEAEPEVFSAALDAFIRTGDSGAMGEFLSTKVAPEAAGWYGEPDYGIIDTIITVHGVTEAAAGEGDSVSSPERNAQKQLLGLMSLLLASDKRENK